MMFGNIYRGRRVLVTGHTGFKGTWLSAWLLKLGADVVGVSKDIPTNPSMFEELGMKRRMKHVKADIRDLEAMRQLISQLKPHFVFHLAAQAIVSKSYRDPVETATTNIIGTLNIMDILRTQKQRCNAVIITSDKCYHNVEWVWGYRETDTLGGKDVYSGSKAATEMIIAAYCRSFFAGGHPVRLAVGRAGNVIGGGDWARDRIVADCMRAWSKRRPVEIRSPRATRPWQHVLEPLSGYLTLGMTLQSRPELHSEAFNFGPRAEQNRTVAELLVDLAREWGLPSLKKTYTVSGSLPFSEAGLLKLDCSKALSCLSWEPNLEYSETINSVSAWYSAYYREHPDMYELTTEQIAAFERKGMDRNRVWAR